MKTKIIFSLVQKSILLLFVMFAFGNLHGQNVNVNPGAGSYLDLSSAFAAINAGTHTGAVTVDIVGNTAEPAGGAILNASGIGSASYTSILIQPSGGVARTITGAATAGSPLIDFVGADNVTINGLNTGGNSLTISNTTVSSTSGTSTIRFIGGATNNTIINSIIQGSATMGVATNGATIFFSTDANTANGNDNNTISNCDIGPAGANLPTKAILGNGSTTTTAIGNSGIVITNNNIFDYFGTAVTSAGVATNGGCNTWSITNNRFYQTGTRTWTTGALHNAINIGNTSTTSGAQGFTITGNIVGYASNTQTGTYTLNGSTGTFRGIIFNGITLGTVSNINSNTIASISLTGVTSSGTSSSAPFMGIFISGGVANTNSNTIGSQSTTGSISYASTSASACDVIGMFNFGSDNWTANNNTIGGITAANAGAGAANLYGLRCNTGSAVTWTCSNNAIGGNISNSLQSTSTATGTIVQGILNANPVGTISGNTIRNLRAAGGTGTTTSASVAGIVITSTANQTIGQNTIFNLSNSNTTAATVVTGLQMTGSTANVVERNLIYGLTTATNSATAEVNGIRVGGGTTIYRNNMIAIGLGIDNAIGGVASNSGTTGINGINEALGTNSFFHNSVLVRGVPTAGMGASYAFNGVQTVNTRSFRNNIFFNARSNSGATGKNYAVKINGTAVNPTGLTINNNVYFANGSGGVFGFYNSLDVANIAGWKAAVGQDAGSFEGNPQYLDIASTTPDLHLHPTNVTVAEGNGADVGVTNDFDGQTRASLTPTDIGADADNFIGQDLSAPVITYTPFLNTSLTSNRILSVTITDVTGVATGGVAPRIYYRKNAGAYFSTQATLFSGTVNNGVWNATIDYSLLGGVVATDVISYHIVAQDTPGNLASNPSAGFTGTDVNTVTTPPTTPSQYTIVASFSGMINVGTAETFTSLTNTGGIFEAINSGALTGNLTLNITSDLATELGTVALNQWAEDGAGNYTLLIKPGGAPRTITGTNTGALIRLNGTDRVTIDGSTSGASAAACLIGGNAALRELTIQNTNVGTAAVVISVQSGTNGAQNNTIRNVNVLGQDPLTTLAGISLGGNTPGTTGTDNDNNRVENCSVRRAFFGIYSAGASLANQNTGTVITKNDLSALTTDRIRRVGILVFNDNGIQITENSIGGIETNESADAVGIGLGTQGADITNTTSGGVTNALVSKNKINGIASLSATGFSATGITVAGAVGGANTISNNMITGVTAPSTSPDLVAGIYVVGVTGAETRLYYNSVSMTGDRGAVLTQTPSFAIAITGTDPVVDLRNNILYTTQIASGGGVNAKSYAIGMATTSFTNLNSNYNNFWSTGVNDGGFRTGSLAAAAGTDYATLALWQAAVSDDANSLEIDPGFLNPLNDLHVPANALSGAGSPIAGITDDIDCNTRSATAPAIGADEQPVVIACPTAPSLLNQTGAVCSGGGTSTFADWQINRASAVAGAGGTGVVNTIEYSTMNPSGGSPATGAGNITGTIPPGCASVNQVVTAYLRCDNGTTGNAADDTWSAIGTYTLTVYPGVQTPTINTVGCSFIVTGACAGDIVTLSAPTTLGVITGNGTNSASFTANAGEPIGAISYSIASGVMGSTCAPFTGASATPACATTCPVLTTPAPAVQVTNSTCTVFGGTPGGGLVSAPSGTCPMGSTLQYSTDAGMNWSATLPTYAQSGPAQSILTRCNCDMNTATSSPTSLMTTVPGTCPICPTLSSAPANVIIINSSCNSGCTLTGGSISAPTGTPCPVGSTLQYQVNGGGWSTIVPVYNQSNPILNIRTRCTCDNDANIISALSGPVNTVPGTLANPSVPSNGFSTVACPTLATLPAPPVVMACDGSTITPTGPTITNNPGVLICEGTRTYTWTYSCGTTSSSWSYIYTIELNPFTVPVNGAATVACVSAITVPVPPAVNSNCGEPIAPAFVSIVDVPTPMVCEGTRTYNYSYTDCEGNTLPWSYTYTIERQPFTVPANGSTTVNSPAAATQPIPPVVLSNCGETLTPTGPVVTNNPNPIVCTGMRTYTWTYTDCEGNTLSWSFTYTITEGSLPCGWGAEPNGVGCNAGNSATYNSNTQRFTLTSTNCYYPNSFTSDALAFAQNDLCGNGSITAQVTSITPLGQGWAGVTMRESNAAGAKKAQLMTNLSAFSRREFRTTTGVAAYPQQFPSQNRYWLRITRTGNQFVMYISPNGTTWYPAGAQNISMNSCIEVGLVVTNYTPNSTVTATFANVSVTGGNITRPAINTQEDLFAVADFSIMPNPTNGLVEIDLSSYHQRKLQMELYNLQGKLLRSINIESVKGKEEVDLTSFANGMYLIRVRAEGLQDVTKRVVVNSNR